MWCTKCVHRTWYPLEALVIMHGDAYVEYCHQRTPETMEMTLAILGCVTQEPMTFDLQKQSISMKKGPHGSTSQHKHLHNKRGLKRPISQQKIQSHIIAYQVFGNSCLAT
jgi:hypothetical protein